MKRIKQSILVALLLVLGVAFVGCNTTTKDLYNLKNVNNAYITLDINPSIEIITNAEGSVDQVNALNDDGIRLLVDQDFTGQTVDVVLDTVLELAIELGYVDFESENAVLITTGAETEEETEKLETNVSAKVKAYIEARKMSVEVLKASLEASEDIKEVAKQYEISVGKVKIITHAMAMDSELTLEAAAEMSIRDLNKIIKTGRNEIREFYSENIRDEYLKLKNELNVNFKLEIAGLYNTKIQEATDDMFVELLVETDTTVEQVKALYQEYYNALVEAKIKAETEVEGESTVVVDPADKEKLEELEIRFELISKELEDLMKQVKSKHGNKLSKDELEKALDRIKEILLEKTEITIEINKLKASMKVEKSKGRFGLGLGLIGKIRLEINHDNIHKIFKNVKEEYEEKFEELGIDLEDLNESFEVVVKAELEAMIEINEKELESVREQFKTDSKAIKVQLKEENEILRKVWKR